MEHSLTVTLPWFTSTLNISGLIKQLCQLCKCNAAINYYKHSLLAPFLEGRERWRKRQKQVQYRERKREKETERQSMRGKMERDRVGERENEGTRETKWTLQGAGLNVTASPTVTPRDRKSQYRGHEFLYTGKGQSSMGMNTSLNAVTWSGSNHQTWFQSDSVSIGWHWLTQDYCVQESLIT